MAKDVQSTLEYASLKSITSRVEIWCVAGLRCCASSLRCPRLAIMERAWTAPSLAHE